MDSLPNNIDQTKRIRNSYPSNYDVQKLYLSKEYSLDSDWQYFLFKKVSYLGISRIKKYKIFSEREDLLQEIYLGIWKAIKTFDPYKNFDFYRWVNWNINNSVRKFINFQKSFCSINLFPEGTLETENPEDIIILREDIQGKINKLSERDKEIIYLYYFENFTLSEISKEKGLSIEGVRKICLRSKEKIKRWLMSNGGYVDV